MRVDVAKTMDEQDVDVPSLVSRIQGMDDAQVAAVVRDFEMRDVPMLDLAIAMILTKHYDQFIHLKTDRFILFGEHLLEDASILYRTLTVHGDIVGLNFLRVCNIWPPMYAPGTSPLMFAYMRCNLALFDTLTEVGMTYEHDARLPVDLDRCRYTLAIIADDFPLLRTLVSRNPSAAKLTDVFGDTALHTVAGHGNPISTAIVASIFSCAERKATNAYGRTALDIALGGNSHPCVDILTHQP